MKVSPPSDKACEKVPDGQAWHSVLLGTCHKNEALEQYHTSYRVRVRHLSVSMGDL